jgi:hypothetical protein
VAVLVVHRGVVRHSAAYGLADLARKVPLTTRTVFHLASLSSGALAKTAAAPVNYAGKWSGTWKNSANQSGNSTLSLTRREDGSLKGTWDNVAVTGAAQADGSLKLTGKTADRSYQLTGRVERGTLYLRYGATNLTTQEKYQGDCTLTRE